jgi:hypothetical protein
MTQSTPKRYGLYLGAGLMGAGVGGVISLWSRRAAQAAVEVRPSLADVGWWDALLADHLTDWLYFHHPTTMTFVSVVITAIVFVAAAFMVIDG